MEIFIVLAFMSLAVLGAPQGLANTYGLPSMEKLESSVLIAPALTSAPVPSIPLTPVAQAPLFSIPAPAPSLPSPVLVVSPVPSQIASPSPVNLSPSPPLTSLSSFTTKSAATLAPFSLPSALPLTQQAPSLTGLSSFPTPDKVGQKISAEEIILPKNTRLSIQDQRGQYSHGFSNNEGTQVSEQGRLITTNGGWEYVIAKKGSYSYISPEGKKITVNYIADENGFRVLGELVS